MIYEYDLGILLYFKQAIYIFHVFMITSRITELETSHVHSWQRRIDIN